MDQPHRFSEDDDTTRVFARPGRRTSVGQATSASPDVSAAASPQRRRVGLWNPNDVAGFLQVSRSWVYQKAEAGLIPVIRLPGSSLLRFEPDDIRAFARGEWKPGKIPVVHAVKARK